LFEAEVLAAQNAEIAGLGREVSPARRADGKERKLKKRAVANAAGGGKKGTGEVVQRTSQHANNSTPC
jgi:hypothetical protein